MEGAWSVSRVLFGIQKTGIAVRQSHLWKSPNPSLERTNDAGGKRKFCQLKEHRVEPVLNRTPVAQFTTVKTK